jgi:prevent-host-death family protein
MRTVNIADLKNNLSAHLERVRAGEELLVKDRNRPIAKLVPLPVGEDLDAEEMELAAAGLLRLPTSILPDSFWKMPAPHVSLKDAVAAVTLERNEDR